MVRIIIAAASLALVAYRPRSTGAAAALVPLAGVAIGLQGTAPAVSALAAAGPMLVFLAAALSLASLAARVGLAARAADGLAWAARGHGHRLYAGVCVLTALLTMAVSLDGAVVLVAPVLLDLRRRYRVPVAPHLLGAVAVANALSAALPQGNPTNLVLMQRLALPVAAFVEHLLPASVAAALVSALAVALLRRDPLRAAVPESLVRAPITRGETGGVVVLALATIASIGAIPFGVSPTWPVAGVASASLVATRARPTIPWRAATQVCALLVVLGPLGSHVPGALGGGAEAGAGVLVGSSLLAALANNLPATAAVASLPLTAHSGLDALLGLSVGALATPHGSVATMVAADLADPAGGIPVRVPLAVAGLAGVAAAGLVVQLTF